MDNFIKSDLESLKDEQIKNIFSNLNLIKINIFPTERQKMIDTIYSFLQSHTQSVKSLKEIDDKDIIDCWQDYIIPIFCNMKVKDNENNLIKQKNLILSEIAKIHSVTEVTEQLEAIARNILLLVFQSLGEKQKDKLIKNIRQETAHKYHFKLTDDILNKSLIEAILNGSAPVALGAGIPIVSGLLFNYLSTNFFVGWVLPTLLGFFGINLAGFKGILALLASPIGWAITGIISLIIMLLTALKFFKQRDQILLVMTILFIYTSVYQNRMSMSVKS